MLDQKWWMCVVVSLCVSACVGDVGSTDPTLGYGQENAEAEDEDGSEGTFADDDAGQPPPFDSDPDADGAGSADDDSVSDDETPAPSTPDQPSSPQQPAGPTPPPVVTPDPVEPPPPTPPPPPPTPPPPPPPPPPSSDCGNAIEAEELALTNRARADAGLSLLRCDPLLARVARAHSNDMCTNNYFSHTGLNGSSFSDRIRAAGGSLGAGGENIAHGQRTASSVHSSWMNSSGHKANILNKAYGRIGIGYVECGGSPYWTQVFTN